MRFPILFALTLLAAATARAENCSVAEAIVVLKAERANDLIATASAINSMPLHGQLLYENGELAGVSITVPDSYAREHQIDSFAVAQKVSAIRDFDPAHFGIRTIRAMQCYDGGENPDYDTGNAGTIGHGR